MSTKNNELLNSAWRMYEEIRSYDLHYSSIRTTVSTFLLAISLSLGAYLLGKEEYLLALIIPTSFLFVSILNNKFFVYVMAKCAKKAGILEHLIRAISLDEKNIVYEGITYTVTEYIHHSDLMPFEFRNGFDQVIREFNVWKNFPKKAYFNEIGVISTSILTVLYFIGVLVFWLLK